MADVHAWYYTDPADPGSWELEPVVRKLMVQFGEGLRFTYVMGGLAREFGPRTELVAGWLDAADRSGMPVDPRLWLESPPGSSYPAGIAVKAAAEQGDPGRYLRRLREGLAVGGRKLDTAEALVAEARAAGLDVERFRIDLASHATLEAFGADLDRCGRVPPEHFRAGAQRVRLPSIEFRAGDEVHGVYGVHPYETFAAAARAAGAEPVGGPAPGIEEALRRFGTMAGPEVAAVCELPGPRAPAELWRLAVEWRVRPERALGGELWSLA